MGNGTGACGVNCLVCGLYLQGKCSPCASGLEPEALDKLAAQLRILGTTCAILQCATERKIGHCSAHCDVYPCRRYFETGYPFSEAFLHMQLRRRGRPPGEMKRVKLKDEGELH